jgi:hypothetical protein
MIDAQSQLELINVALPIPQFFDDAEAVRMREHAEHVGELLHHEKRLWLWHG